MCMPPYGKVVMATTVDRGSEVERAQTDRKTTEKERKKETERGRGIINLEIFWEYLDSRGGELNKQERVREK